MKSSSDIMAEATQRPRLCRHTGFVRGLCRPCASSDDGSRSVCCWSFDEVEK